jgi:hypothetical protein
VLAAAAALAFVGAATADSDIGLRRNTFWPESQPVPQVADAAAAVPTHHRQARRIWAASGVRPLRITLARRAPRSARAHGRIGAALRAANLAPAIEPQVVFPKLIARPVPPRPALVTIYGDRTLRDGDAVMMADGIHVFHGTVRGPHRPGDFVRLTFAAALDRHLRQTLDALDRNPPTRWTSPGSLAG